MKRVLFPLLACAAACFAAEVPKSVKVPAGWQVTLFAAPPDVGYPTCLSTAPNGDLFVGVDENGSIDAKPNRGRVVRCTDADGDGRAEKFVTFATMDSPRGIWFDHNTLYVMHPPFVSAFIDENGDGVSDRSETLVRGLGFDLKFRGADHTVNGMRMGIDGFLYIAVGDYGATNAVGKDGARIQLHGGGVVRVRPDGSGLEIVSRGQRNIYDVAVSPELDLFTRDNTNDGDGWDVRLSHVVLGGQYGYPSLYKKFGDEIIQPLADYGGGSPCGALFMDEPGFPAGIGRGLYTVEWGRNAIMRHPLTTNGASFKAGQEKFIDVVRPTDMDVDGSGRLYISSWEGATFTYNGPKAGYVLRATPPGWAMKTFPDLKTASTADVLKQLGSASAFARLYAQREILRRGAIEGVAESLEMLAASTGPLTPRVAAVFTLQQLLGEKSHPALVRLAKQDAVREFALRALADDRKLAASIPAQPFITALTDMNPRVRAQAVTALGRLGEATLSLAPGFNPVVKGPDASGTASAVSSSGAQTVKTVSNVRAEGTGLKPGVNGSFAATAGAILPLVADSDAMVSHVAVHALVQMRAAEACLAVFDSPGSAKLVPGAGRALQAMHEPRVVDGLIARLNKVSDSAAREIILKTLARLAMREDEWTGKWWGTRPDTTGPYYKPVKWSESEKIESVLRGELAKADAANLPTLVVTLLRNRVELPELTPVVLKLAESDAKFRATAVEMFITRATIPDEAIPLLARTASASDEPASLRARTIRALAKSSKPAALDGAVAALSQPGKLPGDINSAWEDFARDARHGRNVGYFIRLTEDAVAERRSLGYAVLANLAGGKVSERGGRAEAARAVEAGWNAPASTLALLQAIQRLKLDGYAPQVRARLSDSNVDIAKAAQSAAQALKLDTTATAALIEKLKYEDVVRTAVQQKGDAKLGAEIFTRIGCSACHTMNADEAPKGPFLGGIGARYNRAELCESILKPNAKIAQGFETQWFKTKDDEEIEGFITREGGDDLDVRNIAGITTTLAKKDIAQRAAREKSMMPEGLADKITPAELAALLAYLEAKK
jgi:putative heme-binding domain-containing protein